MKLRWKFDAKRQELQAPSGWTITVREIAQMLADRRDCRHDFHGSWAGWKMRRQFLIPPYTGKHGPKLNPENAKRFAEWVAEPIEADRAMRREKPQADHDRAAGQQRQLILIQRIARSA